MKRKKITRRQFLATTAAATVAMSVGPWIKTSHSAGKLSVFLWDHWIPGANDVSQRLIMDWGKKNSVDVTVDYVTSRGDKNLITVAAESRAKTGHDIVDLPTLYTALYKDDLEPMDGQWCLSTAPDQMHAVAEALESEGVEVATTEWVMVATNEVELTPDVAEKVVRMIDLFDDNDDVQKIWTNAANLDEAEES